MSGNSLSQYENCHSCGHTRENHKYQPPSGGSLGGKTFCFARLETTGSSQSCGCSFFINAPDQTVLDHVILDSKDEFDSVLIKMKQVHDKKKADYSRAGNRFSNFEYAASLAGITPEQSFEVLIGVKDARLIELRQPGRTPQNESIEDTLLDRAVYCILALAYYLAHR